MENAAKALTIAGGVLIAIIVVSTLWYSFQQWGILPQAKADNEKISQEVEFNKEFESYNKQNLYGTDVITVINKAIANNQKYGIEGNPEDPYYVDVQFTLESDVYGIVRTYTRKGNQEPTVKEENYLSTPSLYSYKNRTNPYSLKTDFSLLSKLTENNKPVEVKEIKKGNVFTREEKHFADEDFKLRYFTCTGIEKHPTSGRICKIVFKEFHVTDDMKI